VHRLTPKAWAAQAAHLQGRGTGRGPGDSGSSLC
jgi:hypothetical protein